MIFGKPAGAGSGLISPAIFVSLKKDLDPLVKYYNNYMIR